LKSDTAVQHDRTIISVLQDPLPLEPEPFKEAAKRLGISQDEVLQLIAGLIRRGIFRRFGGVLKHDKAGFTFNAMVAFDAPEESCDAMGAAVAIFSFVTHCYRRKSYPDWPYSLYAMMHAKNQGDFDEKLARVKAEVPGCKCVVLPTVKEYKKTSFFLNNA
jgi:DNA-binding Lrp family transcriptional regulator